MKVKFFSLFVLFPFAAGAVDFPKANYVCESVKTGVRTTIEIDGLLLTATVKDPNRRDVVIPLTQSADGGGFMIWGFWDFATGFRGPAVNFASNKPDFLAGDAQYGKYQDISQSSDYEFKCKRLSGTALAPL